MKIILLTLTLILTFQFTSCTKQTATKRSSSNTDDSRNTSNNTSGGNNINTGGNNTGSGNGTGDEPGIPDGGQTTEYYTLEGITLHGTANPNRYASNYPNGVLWSSLTKVGSSDQIIFSTNSRFNLRVRAQNGPSQSSNDSHGEECRYNNDVYTKLKVRVCVRAQDGTCIYTHTFEDIPVGQVSKTKSFNIPATSDPLVVEVLDVQWDYSCTSYTEQGFPNQPGYCPWAPVWDTQCVRFDIQFATDYTKNIPGEYY